MSWNLGLGCGSTIFVEGNSHSFPPPAALVVGRTIQVLLVAPGLINRKCNLQHFRESKYWDRVSLFSPSLLVPDSKRKRKKEIF